MADISPPIRDVRNITGRFSPTAVMGKVTFACDIVSTIAKDSCHTAFVCAVCLHDYKGCHRRGKADEHYLERCEYTYAWDAEWTHERRECFRSECEHAFSFPSVS